MMRRFALLIGVMLGTLIPALALAAVPTMFDRFYDDVRAVRSSAKPSPQIAEFIVEEMLSWGARGIRLTTDDIDLAIAGTLFTETSDGLCQNKKDVAGRDHVFVMGNPGVPLSCLALQADILGLLQSETEADQLGADLMTIASSSELAIADEPHRPLDMGLHALLLKRLWAGNDNALLPWNPLATPAVTALDATLQRLNPEELERAVLRFHHGYFRAEQEADPRFSGVADDVGSDLKAIADVLGITGDTPKRTTFSTPSLTTGNVALWARGDDLGLLWIVPTHAFRLELKPAGAYPEFRENGADLAYPFAYRGAISASLPPASPLCSRMVGREGYLCRPLPDPQENCDAQTNPAAITLVQCDPAVTETTSGPDICLGMETFLRDTGLPFEDPRNPGHLNPALTTADIETLCSPEQKILYPDDITSHACYVGLCLRQSMDGHTLIPNRSPVVANEATSPYLACMRQDPQLGLYTEIVEESPYPLPENLLLHLVRDFERQYCSKNGDAPQALLGLCRYNNNENASLPIESQLVNTDTADNLEQLLTQRGYDFHSIAVSIGQRSALDQSLELERKIFGKLAQFIRQIADLFMELKRAPLTQSACPWTGSFSSIAPSE